MTIGSLYDDQDALLHAISSLYLGGGSFDLDPCFNKGGFYRALKRPQHIGDIAPKYKWCPKMDSTQLPWELWNLESAVFDPPFLVGTGMMAEEYGSFPTVQALWEMYDRSLENFHRVLRPGGTLVVKTQDTSVGGQNFFSHIHIATFGREIGFELVDVFILHNPKRIKKAVPSRMARKEHCYFLIFKKVERQIRVAKF